MGCVDIKVTSFSGFSAHSLFVFFPVSLVMEIVYHKGFGYTCSFSSDFLSDNIYFVQLCKEIFLFLPKLC